MLLSGRGRPMETLGFGLLALCYGGAALLPLRRLVRSGWDVWHLRLALAAPLVLGLVVLIVERVIR